jgi:hypothetical protein
VRVDVLSSQDSLRTALDAYGSEERNRLLDAFTRQRSELKRLFQSYRIDPEEEAEELLEEVMLDVLPRLAASDVQSLEEWIFTLTLQKCIRLRQGRAARHLVSHRASRR